MIRYAGSKDGGRTFSPAVTVAGAALTGARGWHALALGYDGGVHVVWLDGRNAAPMNARARAVGNGRSRRAVETAGGPRQDIFHASWKGDGARSEHPVAAIVCFCCKTAIATAGEHVYAAWRHIYPGSLRDIAVARSTDNGATFGDPIRVSEDGWKIDACPDDGPAMVADGHGGIHIAWPTLVPGDTPRKGIFYSALAGDAFAPRLRLDSGEADPAHPQIAADDHTNTAVVWDERAGESRGASCSAPCRTAWRSRRSSSPATASAIRSLRRPKATGSSSGRRRAPTAGRSSRDGEFLRRRRP